MHWSDILTMSDPRDNRKRHGCIVNIGLFRSGTTTLAETASSLGLKAYRTFPGLSRDQHKSFLQNPQELVLEWFSKCGAKEIIQIATDYDIICDGWTALLPFLPSTAVEDLKVEAEKVGVHLIFVATTRNTEGTVQSELHHWTIHDLERQAGLTANERDNLELHLRERAEHHQRCVLHLHRGGLLKLLPLSDHLQMTWSEILSEVTDSTVEEWSGAFQTSGQCNATPPLPIEGILLTQRFGSRKESDEKILSIEKLLDKIEQDSLCRYLVVLGIDEDEASGSAAGKLIRRLESRAAASQKQMLSLHVITNPARSPDQPFAICSIWNELAIVAWKQGAAWVVLLGDDIEVGCQYHYRAIYRSFLDIANRMKVPFGFGCPWWNDTSFPGFPSFPCVGKTHFEIFGRLIPEKRKEVFVNQDLDPYLQHLYLKFNAAPCVTDAVLSNTVGGNIGSSDARYDRIPAVGWRDFVLDDIDQIRASLPNDAKENILLDVIVPSYRVRLDYLKSICSLKVPEKVQVNFIIIVDNPDALLRSAWDIEGANDVSLARAERILECFLSKDGNNIRVRCNNNNMGASASRNRGLDESAAEYVLHLDDDLVPNSDLLEQYARKLFEIDETVVGLVGLVRFPRSSRLPLRHAAVLMSYLTFMFEIAEQDIYKSYKGPAWGVTANILFRRTSVRFDLAYAKTGGGEDVDYSLRVTEACNGGWLQAVPEACVVHPFWPGSAFTLAKHFYSWAIGDGALFQRFPKYCYWSFPNVSEMLLFLLPLSPWIGPWRFFELIFYFILVDLVVDCWDPEKRRHRRLLLQANGHGEPIAERSLVFYWLAHILANLYVVVLECGRLRGHIGRMDLAHGMFRRFDWHIGRLPSAPRNFRQRESYKFACFVIILAALFAKSTVP